ncbi:hypothetical protein [Armatimonas sp.]|uniref:hypothetical protein n=1 Tax=Armatimonas sp. TaxID=1872638 RepID=UPI00374D21B2
MLKFIRLIVVLLVILLLNACGGGKGEALISNKSVIAKDDSGVKVGTFVITQVFTEDYSTASISSLFRNESGKKISFDYEIIGDQAFLLFYNFWKSEGHLELVQDKQNIDMGIIASSTLRIDVESARLYVRLKNVNYSD